MFSKDNKKKASLANSNLPIACKMNSIIEPKNLAKIPSLFSLKSNTNKKSLEMPTIPKTLSILTIENTLINNHFLTTLFNLKLLFWMIWNSSDKKITTAVFLSKLSPDASEETLLKKLSVLLNKKTLTGPEKLSNP